MQLKCIILDDDPEAVKIIKDYAQRLSSLRLINTFVNVENVYEYLQQYHADLLFIDINTKGSLDLAASLQHKLPVIFTSAYKEYALKGFDLEAIDYLLKPLEFERFKKAVGKAIQYYSYRENNVLKEKIKKLFVRSGHKIVKIDIRDIEYIQGFVDYIKIHLLNQKPVLTLMTFRAIIDKLPSEEFKRIHRSYIVPVSKVKMIKSKKVQMISSIELPVSKSYIDFIHHWKSSD